MANFGKNNLMRHNARETAVQALYQWQLSGRSVYEIFDEFTEYHTKKNSKPTGRFEVNLEYLKELLIHISENFSTIDEVFAPYLDRPLNEVDPIELAILRIGTFELAHKLEIPYKVVINESLELTKKFGSIEGFKFVNSIMDKVAKKLRPIES